MANSGDNAWVLAASALVLLMTLPGLALFYAGLVRGKNALSVMVQCVAIACLASVLWLVVGYSLSFSGAGALIGDLRRVGLLGLGVSSTTSSGLSEAVFCLFQMTFVVITPALVIGAYVERVRFQAVLIFSALWLLVVYAPVAHWVWGGGWLAAMGVKDFAGGLVVHATAGVSALVFAVLLGKRDGFPHNLHPPHNPGWTMIGAGLLWVGWYGFNGGSALSAGGAAAMAILVTHFSASMAGLVWGFLEWRQFGRPSMVGVVTGVVAGLATVTPASGFVGPIGGLVLGALGAVVCFNCVHLVRNRWKIDDSLDVFAVHGVGGILGTLLLAGLAHPRLGGMGYGLDEGPLGQFFAQVVGVVAVCAWSGVATLGIGLATKALVGLRATDEEIDEGLDSAYHGEHAHNI